MRWRAQDSRALINAKSAQAILKGKMKEAQQSIRAAALSSQALARAKLVDREVPAPPRPRPLPA